MEINKITKMKFDKRTIKNIIKKLAFKQGKNNFISYCTSYFTFSFYFFKLAMMFFILF